MGWKKMNRKKAIEYLIKKGKIEDKQSYNPKDEEEIQKVVSSGKVYGDPVAKIDW
jgi:hypothetical protein